MPMLVVMNLGRIGWLMSWLSVIALVLAVAMPQRVMAAPMTAMMQTSHCTDCPGGAPVPGKAIDHHPKAVTCSPSMCVGAVAAVLPSPGAVNRPVWHPTSYTPGPLVSSAGRPLAPDPLPPRSSAEA